MGEREDVGPQRVAFASLYWRVLRSPGGTLGELFMTGRQEGAGDDADCAQFGGLLRVESAGEAPAQGTPELFLLAEELAKRVNDFTPCDGADCGGQDFAAVADLVPVLVLVLVGLGRRRYLLVELGEARTVRADQGMCRVEPQQVERVEPAVRGARGT